ncbi:hypothetical protein PV375_05640 [Gulosibacter sp. GYB002]|uniref:hypothetical protein n=1 Tax=Gulosibacter sp. GYB002 TaxID=2994391 RepID=UPI002F963D26
MEIVKKLWHLVEEPRTRRVMWSLIYASILMAGLVAVIMPPRSVEWQLGHALTLTWGLMLTAGGGLGAWSTLTRFWVVERMAILLCGHGAAIYGATIVANQIIEDGNRMTQFGFVVAFILALAVRHWDIRYWNRDPR